MCNILAVFPSNAPLLFLFLFLFTLLPVISTYSVASYQSIFVESIIKLHTLSTHTNNTEISFFFY